MVQESPLAHSEDFQEAEIIQPKRGRPVGVGKSPPGRPARPKPIVKIERAMAISSLRADVPLRTIMDPLNETQREYLLMRLCGEDYKEAHRIAWNKCHNPMDWLQTPEWQALEGRIMSRKSAYIQEALLIYAESCGLMGMKILYSLLKEAVEDFKKMNAEDKKHVMNAVGIFTRINISQQASSEGPKGSYEKFIHELHREVT